VEEHLPGKCKALSLVPSTGRKKGKIGKKKKEKEKRQNPLLKTTNPRQLHRISLDFIQEIPFSSKVLLSATT
jgi:hypothetical protein